MNSHHLTAYRPEVLEVRAAFLAESKRPNPDRRLLDGYLAEAHRLQALPKYPERPPVANVLDMLTAAMLRPVSAHLRATG